MNRRSSVQDRRQREQHEAARRLRRLEQAAFRPTLDPAPSGPQQVLLDSERYAAPLLQRLDARERVRLLLWGAVLIALACAIFSFFTTPLMPVDQAVETTLVLAMLILSYVL